MRTSNILLVSFVGVAFVVMAVCNFVMKVDFEAKKNAKIEVHEYKPLHTTRFNHLKIIGEIHSSDYISIDSAAQFDISVLSEINDYVKFKFIGDTASIEFLPIPDSLHLERDNRIRIKCSSLKSITIANVYMNVYSLQSENLAIKLSGDATLRMHKGKFKNVSVVTKDSSEVILEAGTDETEHWRTNIISHIKLKLLNKSKFTATDVPFKSVESYIGDSVYVTFSGRSLDAFLKPSKK